MHPIVNVLTYARKILTDCMIGDTQNSQTVSFQKSCAHLVFHWAIVFIMLGTIQFNHQVGFGTIKISNIVS